MTTRRGHPAHDHYGEQPRRTDLGPLFGPEPDEMPSTPVGGEAPPRSLITRDRARMPDDAAVSHVPHQRSSPTSTAAAFKLGERGVGSKLHRVWRFIVGKGPVGATRQEIADELDMLLQSVCATVRKLYTMGRVGSNPGHTRPNRISHLDNEVLLHEDFVTRWAPEQTRPGLLFPWEDARGGSK